MIHHVYLHQLPRLDQAERDTTVFRGRSWVARRVVMPDQHCTRAGDDSVIPGVAFLSSMALINKAHWFVRPEFPLAITCFA